MEYLQILYFPANNTRPHFLLELFLKKNIECILIFCNLLQEKRMFTYEN
jgi:hypothetical protein